jgi:23S rRNA pseudouridine1911/1915/1917 synthase
MDISVIYEDRDYLVINKPSGVITHPKNESDKSPSVTEWVLKNHPEAKGVGEYPDRPGIMHRLDKETSGLLVIAKNQTAYDHFKKLFQTRAIKKYYTALVIGRPKADRGLIEAPIGRIGMKRTTIQRRGKLKDEKTAATEYRVLKNFDGYSLLEVAPRTGRTHQIRVHLQHIGCPVAGDRMYAPENAPRPKGLTRLFLHAQRLEFTAPDGKALSLEAELPDELKAVLENLD